MTKYHMLKYQAIIDGETVTVDELAEKQAKQQLCECIDLIEQLDYNTWSMNDFIGKWRNAK